MKVYCFLVFLWNIIEFTGESILFPFPMGRHTRRCMSRDLRKILCGSTHEFPSMRPSFERRSLRVARSTANHARHLIVVHHPANVCLFVWVTNVTQIGQFDAWHRTDTMASEEENAKYYTCPETLKPITPYI